MVGKVAAVWVGKDRDGAKSTNAIAIARKRPNAIAIASSSPNKLAIARPNALAIARKKTFWEERLFHRRKNRYEQTLELALNGTPPLSTTSSPLVRLRSERRKAGTGPTSSQSVQRIRFSARTF